MIRHYLDTEFNGFGGDLISLALACEDGRSLYLVTDKLPEPMDPWVRENVVPYLYDCPAVPLIMSPKHWGHEISAFIYCGTKSPQIIADWPSDIADFANLLLTGPGEAVPMGHQTHLTIVRHIDVYPTDVKGAVQHNAWYDAMALKRYIELAEGR